MTAQIIKLPSYKPDTFLKQIRKSMTASKMHVGAINRLGFDGPYDKTDVARELGYQEGLALAEYFYKRRFKRDKK